MGLFSFLSSPVKSFLGDLTGANDAEKALKDSNSTARTNAKNQLQLQERMYNESVGRMRPFYNTGLEANKSREQMLTGGYNMKSSPAAQYSLTQGTKSLNRQLAARGLLGSGNAAQRLAELSSGIAANDYSNRFSQLSSLVDTGMGSAQSQNTAGSQASQLGTSTYQNLNSNIASNNSARAQLYVNTSPIKVMSDIAGAAGSMGAGGGL